eukprot:CAMPEP_0196594622 /NCGR_PEP_ID=MMETSP1081-20130531/78837_1 /TAXON_ID=36882 /ORGANISM="Pyramimonas amylifera, Strain CCMP720" /LENGTH=84 /DNA_ID=CAMNT_0041918935 /DNA_START=456 /DNA_END=707 /DNA_ORIENTATION=+
MSVCLKQAGETDDLNQTVNYSDVYSQIRGIMEGTPHHQLIESVAEKIAGEILETHPLVKDITVSVHKPHVALYGPLESLGVEIW